MRTALISPAIDEPPLPLRLCQYDRLSLDFGPFHWSGLGSRTDSCAILYRGLVKRGKHEGYKGDEEIAKGSGGAKDIDLLAIDNQQPSTSTYHGSRRAIYSHSFSSRKSPTRTLLASLTFSCVRPHPFKYLTLSPSTSTASKRPQVSNSPTSPAWSLSTEPATRTTSLLVALGRMGLDGASCRVLRACLLVRPPPKFPVCCTGHLLMPSSFIAGSPWIGWRQ